MRLLHCYITSTDFVHVLFQNRQSSIDKLVTSNRLPLFANVRSCTQTIVSSHSPPKSIHGRCLSTQTRLHLRHSASVLFILLSFYLLHFLFFLLSHLRGYRNCIPLFNWSYPRVILPPSGFEIMHHLQSFHGDPKKGTQPSQKQCSMEMAMELLKVWHESDKPFFTKKDLQDISNQLTGRYERAIQSDWSLSRASAVQDPLRCDPWPGPLRRGEWRVVSGKCKLLMVSFQGSSDTWPQLIHTYQNSQERKLRYSCYGQLVSAVEFRRIELAEVFFPLQIEHFMLARTSDAKQPTSPDSPSTSRTPWPWMRLSKQPWGPGRQPPSFRSYRPFLSSSSTPTKSPRWWVSHLDQYNLVPKVMMITHRSAVQHSIMITIRNRIEEITNKKIQCYAQDPCYTAVDTWALAQHGCKVLEDPQALLEIDNDCVLFSCCPDLLLKEITVDFARPAILIWDRVVPGKILGRWVWFWYYIHLFLLTDGFS